MVTTTQQAHPWRAVARTLAAVLIPLAAAAPEIVGAITNGDPAAAGGWLGGVVTASAAITRVMAVPAVDQLLSRIRLSSAPAVPATTTIRPRPTVDLGDVDEHAVPVADVVDASPADDSGPVFGVWP